MINYKTLFSEDVACFRSSPIREVLKNVDISKIYSFSGGYPAPETFPLKSLNSLTQRVVDKYGDKTLQYGDTRGVPEFRKAIAERYDLDVEKVQITSSSQQGIDVCARILLNPGDVVLCENPCYLGALNSFYSYQAEVVGLDLSQSFEASQRRGEEVEKLLAKGKKIKFFYVIPDFQNPGGHTLSLAQRAEIVSLARRFGFLIVEDSPYREIRFEGEDVASIYSLAPDITLHLGSISKVFAPGLRLGWVIAEPELLNTIFVCKQSLDLCPNVLSQYLALEFLESGELDKNLLESRKIYKRKRDKLESLLEKYLPEGSSWTQPQGGLFIFVTLPESLDVTALFPEAIKRGVAYVPGSYFFTDGSHRNTMRLSFSFIDEEKMETGMEILSKLLKENL